MLYEQVELEKQPFMKFSADFKGQNLPIPPLHLIIVNQQMYIIKNIYIDDDWLTLVLVRASCVFDAILSVTFY